MSRRIKVKVGGDDYIEDWKAYLSKSKAHVLAKWFSESKAKTKKGDFQFLDTIATGGSAKVVLAMKKNTFYAIKVMKKRESVTKKKFETTLNERRALHAIRFNFIIHMEYYFVDEEHLYFVMPYIAGGDLWSHLKRSKRLTEAHARFYVSQILLAVEYLHYVGLIYRDLKPENILIDKDGYIKLTDLGFCKPIGARTYTLCGSIEYMAPEVVLNKGYGLAADWWSYGVLLYELCAGQTPFFCDDEYKLFQKISKCEYRMDRDFSKLLQDLIRNLLRAEPTHRYGNLKNGVDGIKQHLWFEGVDWIQVLNKKVPPPFIPITSGPEDLSNFRHDQDERLPSIEQASVFNEQFIIK